MVHASRDRVRPSRDFARFQDRGTDLGPEIVVHIAVIRQIGKLDAEVSSGGGSGRRGVSPTPLSNINVSLGLVHDYAKNPDHKSCRINLDDGVFSLR